MKRRRRRSGWAVGVDLGNVYSAVAATTERGPTPIPDRHGNALLPSVAVSCETGVLVGEPAASVARNRPDMLQHFRQEPRDEANRIMPRGTCHISCDGVHTQFLTNLMLEVIYSHKNAEIAFRPVHLQPR